MIHKLLAALLLLPTLAHAATFTITTGTTGTWSCATARTPDGGGSAVAVGPGDVIKFDGGTRGRIRLTNCVGSEASPIRIINDPADAPVTFTNGDTLAIFDLREFEWIIVDGTGGYSGMPTGAYCGVQAGVASSVGCGFRVVPDANDFPPAFFRFFGTLTSNVEVRGVYVDGALPSDTATGSQYGFYLHDVSTERGVTGAWRENYLIENNYCVATRGTCFYVGPNTTDANGDPIPLRNIRVRNNAAINPGGNGIIAKIMLEGTNEISGNYVDNTGLRLDSNAPDCIRIGDGKGNIFGNYVSRCAGRGLNVALTDDIGIESPFETDIYNNLVNVTGTMYQTSGEGIRTFSTIGNLDADIYNNTVVGSNDDGIRASNGEGNASHNVANNIVADAVGTAVVATGGTTSGNQTGTSASMVFVSGTDFHLQAMSPAVDAATESPTAAADIEGTARPVGAAADAGAYEFQGSEGTDPGDEFHIYTNTAATAWDCGTQGVGPGDTITLHSHTQGQAAAAHTGAGVETVRTGRVQLQNCIGTRTQPILVRNDPNDRYRLTIHYGGTNGNFGGVPLSINNSDYVTVDGTGGWVGMPEGARCGGTPGAYNKVTHAFTGHGTDGCGIYVKAGAWNTSTMYVRIQGFVEGDGNSDANSLAGQTGGAVDQRPGTCNPSDFYLRSNCYDGNRGITFKGLEIDGTLDIPDADATAIDGTPGNLLTGAPFPAAETGGVGMYLHDIVNGGIARGANGSLPGKHPGAWREDIAVTDSYIHHVFGEAIYAGNNVTAECNGEFCAPNRGLTIARNIIGPAGRDCVNPKMWLDGDNRVHDNFITGCAYRKEDWEDPALIVNTSRMKIYRNRIFDTLSRGIMSQSKADEYTDQFKAFTPFLVEIYNNLVVRAGAATTMYKAVPGSSPQHIDPTSAYAPGNDAEASIFATSHSANKTNFRIFQNTVVTGDGTALGVDCGSSPCKATNGDGAANTLLVMNNLEAHDNAAYESIDTDEWTATCISGNTKVASSGAGFVDAANDNYSITSDSDAADTAITTPQASCPNYTGVDGNYGLTGTSSYVPYAEDDILQAARPFNAVPDRGAYEVQEEPPETPDQFTIATSTVGQWDCSTSRVPDFGGSAKPVGPGDTVLINGGSRGRLQFINCAGENGSPITIKNNPASGAPVQITNFGGNPGLDLRESEYVVIDGTGGWSGMPGGASCGAPANTNQGCGLQIIADSNDNPTAHFRFFGELTSHIALRGILINGEQGFAFNAQSGGARYGFYLADASTVRDEGEWREDILLEEFYVTGTRGDAVEAGPASNDAGGNPIPLRDVTIQNGVIENVGGAGIALRAAIEGDNLITGMIIDRTARRGNSTDADCIKIGDGVADVHGNRLSRCGGRGINLTLTTDLGVDFPITPEFFNNVIDGAGREFRDQGDGIRTHSTVGTVTASIYSNTIVDAERHGISSATDDGNSGHTVANNLISGVGEEYLHTSGATLAGNVTGPVARMLFTDSHGGDLTVQPLSPAIDTVQAAPYSASDIDGTARPEDLLPDAGAYEFVGTPGLRISTNDTGFVR